MTASILDHRYDLQYVLYLLALHRQLKARLPDTTTTAYGRRAVSVFARYQAPEPGRVFHPAAQSY
jgi:exodeoxyribonuclease V beta subunit